MSTRLGEIRLKFTKKSGLCIRNVQDLSYHSLTFHNLIRRFTSATRAVVAERPVRVMETAQIEIRASAEPVCAIEISTLGIPALAFVSR